MDDMERYLNFVRNYNAKLKDRKTGWLGPEDLGAVLLQTALENDPGAFNKPGQVLPGIRKDSPIDSK